MGEVWLNSCSNLNFKRLLNDCEIGMLTKFTTPKNSLKSSPLKMVIFGLEIEEVNSLLSQLYKELNHSNNQIGCWSWKLIWKVKIPYKLLVSHGVWPRKKSQILTLNNLLLYHRMRN